MLSIRPEQMAVFQESAEKRFLTEMVEHSKVFSPVLCKLTGEEQLRVALRSAIKRAGEYGFTCKGSIRLFIELTFLFGGGFDTDPQYAVFGDILRRTDHEMLRAQRMHEAHNGYLEKVSGQNGEHVQSALKELSVLAKSQITGSRDGLAEAMLREMKKAFPRKVTYTGEERLLALIKEGEAEAAKYDFSGVRAVALMVILMFAFGHSCATDPLYPWIARTLGDEKIVSPAARAERLESKAMTWLNHVLGEAQTGIS